MSKNLTTVKEPKERVLTISLTPAQNAQLDESIRNSMRAKGLEHLISRPN